MISADSWVVNVVQGQHRVCALAALGYETVPVRVYLHTVARVADTSHWPQVAAGRMTEYEARKVFNAVHLGRPPPAHRWVPPQERCTVGPGEGLRPLDGEE